MEQTPVTITEADIYQAKQLAKKSQAVKKLVDFYLVAKEDPNKYWDAFVVMCMQNLKAGMTSGTLNLKNEFDKSLFDIVKTRISKKAAKKSDSTEEEPTEEEKEEDFEFKGKVITPETASK